MTDDELYRQAEVLARDLHARGFLVTIDFAVEPAAIADLIGLRSIDMLRRWRHELIGPPHRTHGRVVLYPLDSYLVWKGVQRKNHADASVLPCAQAGDAGSCPGGELT